jgi:cytochrome c553
MLVPNCARSTWTFLLACVLALCASAARADAPSGAEIYKEQCIRCHGAQGQGTKRYKQRLEGDRSVAQLAALIHKTMPDDAVGLLSPEEAQAVAAYVHESFYSPLARERTRGARIELARLTTRQYRQVVADLVGSFRSQPKWDDRPGLNGEYFNSRRFRASDRVLERTDTSVNFDFGTEGPVAGKFDPNEFSIRWTGSLLAPETGEYQFIIRTEHAARLWVNDTKRPLIDAWVKSGKDTEFTGSLFLVAGRMVPLRLEYSKAKQGVDDSQKNKGKKPPAVKSSIALLWKEPHGTIEPIPGRQLSPASSPEAFLCSTPFPPDDRSYGWERGTTVSKEWDQATTDAALDTVDYIVRHLFELSGVRDDARERQPKLLEFCRTFAERAFRRPLTDDQKALIERQFTGAKDLDTALKRALLLVLKSPRFLYREIGGTGDGYDLAARLSFGLWDSLPDRDLLNAAQAGKLSTREEVRKQAERMLTDLRARAKLRSFLLTWVKADHGLDLAKDARKFPGFDSAVISDLRTSLTLFLDDVLWSETSDFRQLLLSDQLFLNGRLAKFYGAQLPADAGFQKVKLDNGKRAGVLTHPYLMTSFASSGESSPIHRGVFVARGVLGLALKTPPAAVAPLAPALHPNLTTRERVILQTSPSACMTCHTVINPLGFTLENFDAVGRFREKDHGKLIDPAGSYQTRTGKTVQVKGARELATFLANSPEVQGAFAEQLFHHLVQQPVAAHGPNTLDELRTSFAGNGLHIRKLAVEIMTIAALQSRAGNAGPPKPP